VDQLFSNREAKSKVVMKLNKSPNVDLNKDPEDLEAYIEPFSLFLVSSVSGYNMTRVLKELEKKGDG
jgi:hypothetical protein